MHYKKIFIVSCILALKATSAFSATITISADDWCPFNCNPASDRPGYVVEIAKAIYEPLGHKINYVQEPWPRTLKLVEEGKLDAAIGATPEELPSGVFSKEPAGMMENVLFVHNAFAGAVNAPSDLDGKTIGIMKGYDFSGSPIGDYVMSKVGSNQVQDISSESGAVANVKKLKAKRIDVVIDDKSVLNYLAKSIGANKDLKVLSPIAPADPIYLGFSGAKEVSKTYAKDFDEGMSRLRASGELAKILEKYGLSDWK